LLQSALWLFERSRMFSHVLCVAGLLFMGSSAARVEAAPAADKDVSASILAMERAALDRSDKGDTEGFLEISAPDVTYFDPFLDAPIRGLENLRAYYRGFPAQQNPPGEMTNAHVQVLGTVAVLTFNYTSHSKMGTLRWNTTEVYQQGAEGWRIVHTNWALMKPHLCKPE